MRAEDDLEVSTEEVTDELDEDGDVVFNNVIIGSRKRSAPSTSRVPAKSTRLAGIRELSTVAAREALDVPKPGQKPSDFTVGATTFQAAARSAINVIATMDADVDIIMEDVEDAITGKRKAPDPASSESSRRRAEAVVSSVVEKNPAIVDSVEELMARLAGTFAEDVRLLGKKDRLTFTNAGTGSRLPATRPSSPFWPQSLQRLDSVVEGTDVMLASNILIALVDGTYQVTSITGVSYPDRTEPEPLSDFALAAPMTDEQLGVSALRFVGDFCNLPAASIAEMISRALYLAAVSFFEGELTKATRAQKESCVQVLVFDLMSRVVTPCIQLPNEVVIRRASAEASSFGRHVFDYLGST